MPFDIHDASIRLEAWSGAAGPGRLAEIVAGGPDFAHIVALRLALPAELANELTRHPEPGVRAAIARRPEGVSLVRLASDPSPEVRAAVALNEAADADLVIRLAADDEAVVRRAVAGRFTLPAALRLALVDDPNPRVRLAMLRRSDRTADELRRRIDDPDAAIRALVAASGVARDTAGSDLARQLADSNPAVRLAAVEGHEEELQPYLATLVRDPDVKIRRRVAWPRTIRDPDLIAILATDADAQVRTYAARNIFAPAKTLIALAGDPSLSVRIGITDNPLAPPQALARLGDDLARADTDIEWDLFALGKGPTHWKLVMDLIGHPATPSETLRALHAKGIPEFNSGNMTEQPNWPVDVLIPEALAYAAPLIEDDERPAFETVARAAARVTAEPASAAGVLRSMLESPIYHLRKFAAVSRFTPPEALAAYAANHPESDADLIHSLARNPATPMSALVRLYDKDEGIHWMLKNPELPLEALEWIERHYGEDYGEKARILLKARRLRTV